MEEHWATEGAPAVYGYVLRGSIWTCSVRVCAQRQYMDLQCKGMCSEAVYMDLQYMGMCSEAVYGPAV